MRYATHAEARACQLTNEILCDDGPRVFPRYCLLPAPKIGDQVSKSFNGDSYPAGEILSISKSLRRIETTTGVVFWRRGQSSAWVAEGVWYMIPGHVYEQNPSF
jgi:hypothetical protein